MNLFAFFPLMGNMGGASTSSPGSIVTSLLPLAAIMLIFYFLVIRPQNRKNKETQNMLANLKKGDKVVTIGGVHGVIQSVKEKTVILKVDEFTKMEFSRPAISSIVADEKGDKEKGKAEITDQSDSAEESED